MKRLQPYKSRPWALLMLLALAVLAMIFLSKSSHKQNATFSYAMVKSGGDTLDVAIELNPGVYRVAGDTVTGRDYEVLQRISREFGVPIKYHPFVPLRHAMEGLNRGDYDVVVASMPSTSSLKDYFLMTSPVYLDREVLVQKLDSAQQPKITSQIQLGGDTVWISNDSPIAARIQNLSKEIGDTIYIMQEPHYTAEHLVVLVNAGVIRLAVINESVAKAMREQFPQIDISTPISFTQFQCWAVSKDNPALCDSLNHWLSATAKAQ